MFNIVILEVQLEARELVIDYISIHLSFLLQKSCLIPPYRFLVKH